MSLISSTSKHAFKIEVQMKRYIKQWNHLEIPAKLVNIYALSQDNFNLHHLSFMEAANEKIWLQSTYLAFKLLNKIT